jgi:hypothetical protein
MSRAKRIIKYADKTWTVSSLVPADFLECSFWPFSYYRLPEDNLVKSAIEVKRDWNLKPKNKISDEAKLEQAIRQAFMVGLGINFDKDFEAIKSDQTLYNILLFEIYSLTYRLKPVDKILVPFELISRDFAEALAIKAKAINLEPFSLISDLSRELPELYNPKRYDFNWFILGVGWERERREIEKAQAEAKSRARLRVR